MPINSFLYPGAKVTPAYEVANSVIFDTDASLTKTPSSAGNRKTFTFSAWIKGQPTTATNSMSGQAIYSAGTSATNRTHWYFSDGTFQFRTEISDSQKIIITNRLFVDPSAWYHFVLAVDTTQGTDTNRVKIYVNGVQETSFSSASYPSQNDDTFVNNSQAQYIGRSSWTASSYFNGYMAEVVLLDGTAASPTDFGEFDEDSPTIWKPKNVSGLTFGTNGFYLDFEDSSNLGNDANGGDDFTEANLAATDQSTDTCTNNFATMNPLNPIVHTFSEGNLRLTGTTTNWDSACSTIAASSGKWYFEMKFLALYGGLRRAAIGLVDARDQTLLSTNEFGYIVTGAVGDCVGYNGNGTSDNIKKNDSNVANGTQWSVNDIICMAVDLDNGAVYFRVNDSAWLNSGNPESGSSKTGAITITVGQDYVFGGTAYGNTTDWQFNYGSPSFSISSGNTDGNGYGNFEYSVPSGYFSLCTKNLAEYG